MLLVTLVSVTFCLRSREKPKDRLVLNLIIAIDAVLAITKEIHWRE